MQRIELFRGVGLDVPVLWERVSEMPAVVMPRGWRGEPPAIVVDRYADDLRGAALAVELVHAVDRLDDGVLLDVRLAADGGSAELLAAHRSQGVAVTTLERHHCRVDGRWVVAFTAVDRDWLELDGVAAAVVASLKGPE